MDLVRAVLQLADGKPRTPPSTHQLFVASRRRVGRETQRSRSWYWQDCAPQAARWLRSDLGIAHGESNKVRRKQVIHEEQCLEPLKELLLIHKLIFSPPLGEVFPNTRTGLRSNTRNLARTFFQGCWVRMGPKVLTIGLFEEPRRSSKGIPP